MIGQHTGIKPADATKHADNISYGTYVLFGDDAYVIGAVVVGEDAGSTSNFVYTISGNANRESYSSADDEYTWTRPVALDGQEDELTYVGDSLKEIGNTTTTGHKGDAMVGGEWYFVRYYADGTVKDAVQVPATAAVGSEYQRYVVAGTIADAVDAIDKRDAERVLLNNADESEVPEFKNGSLYSQTDVSKGIWVSPDVNVVRIQYVDNDPFGEIEYYDGRDGLEDALEDLGTVAADSLEVSAIVEDGAAMVIVLNNTNPSITDEGEQVSGTVRVISDDADNDYATPTYYNPGKALTTAQENDLVYDMLRDAGCTGISNSGSSFTFTKPNGREVTQTINMTQVFKVTAVYADDMNANWTDTAIELDTQYVAQGGNVKFTFTDSRADQVYNSTYTWDCDWSVDGGKTFTDNSISLTGNGDNTVSGTMNMGVANDVVYRITSPDNGGV